MATDIRAAPRRLDPQRCSDPPLIVARRDNILSINSRPVITSFDDHGPGAYSPSGPRHDNDHVCIKHIQVFPTTDEILSLDRPYMPLKNLSQPHFLPNGPLRHFDTLFRHLRFDKTEAIRDICYHAAQNLAYCTAQSPSEEPKRITAAGNRYFGYKAVEFEEINAEEKKGILVRFSYLCPKLMRGKSMHESGRLIPGMLCAVIFLERNSELSVVFMEIHLRQSTRSMHIRGGRGMRAAIELSLPPSATYHDILTITRLAQGLSSPRMVLVEFPSLLHAGVYSVLHRLQCMQSHDVAMLKYIAPALDESDIGRNCSAAMAGFRKSIDCGPPFYTQEPDFAFKLDGIACRPASFTASQIRTDKSSFLEFLGKNTQLDDGQAIAFARNLTYEFSFTQGPPGTGKTFLGISLTRTLLASRNKWSHQPILVVCKTNHALDNFLSELRDAGVENLIRIGSNSKEEWTNSINLREKSNKSRLPKNQWQIHAALLRQKRAMYTDLECWCKALNAERNSKILSWQAVEKYLAQENPKIYRQFTDVATSKGAEALTFEYWATGGDLQNLEDLENELSVRLLARTKPVYNSQIGAMLDVKCVLEDTVRQAWDRCHATGEDIIWKIPLAQRKTLVQAWNRVIDREELAERLASMQVKHVVIAERMRSLFNEKDVDVLLKASVIGMTTTASASRWDMMKTLGPEILICEEAGEVLEAHSICSLFPTVQHAIFIGDPKQLRPEVEEPCLSAETSIGQRYRLDESMFERFMMPMDPAGRVIPTSQLNIQRRMHPSIAELTRLTYPTLLDHDFTSSHSPVSGISQRMFWLDHRVPEDDSADKSRSHVNTHEVQLVLCIVLYLLTRHVYSAGDIAVLTPYNGQLAALFRAFQKTCQIFLSPKDREALVDSGTLADAFDRSTGPKEGVEMTNLLRIATVDNFQGEEAKIIILSTVRSGGRAGFLKIENRINVACSRARNGFFIVGNSKTLEQVPFWGQIINVFRRDNRIDSRLRLCCDRHPHHHVEVAMPSDFDNFQECDIPCSQKLACGHICFERCHDLAAHDRIPCEKPCRKILECGHKCAKPCSHNCGSCQSLVADVVLDCGHRVSKLCSETVPQCLEVVRRETLPCGHEVNISCFKEDAVPVCYEPCGGELAACGHQCRSPCRQCWLDADHPLCTALCDVEMSCSHRCQATCHAGLEHPPCSAPCVGKCSHGTCKNRCGTICDPCVKPFSGDEFASGRMICSLGSIVRQPGELQGVFDRLTAMVSRKIHRLAMAIEENGLVLRRSHDSLLNKIRPSPLVAKSNKFILTTRGRDLRKVIDEVVDLRYQVVDPFEESMITFRSIVPEAREFALQFHLRLDILENRARSVLVRDILSIAQHLEQIEDTSNEIQRQAVVLQTVAIRECLKCIQSCQASVSRRSASPIVQAELLLQEVEFGMLMESPSSPVTTMKPRNHVLLDRAALLCGRYPNTAGAFLEIVENLRNYAKTDKLPRVPSVSCTKSRKVEKDWGDYVVGHLKICPAKHPYSSRTFPMGCPECGPTVELVNESFQRSQVFLQEAEFMKVLHTQ